MIPLKAQHNFDNFNFVAFAFNAHKTTNAICNIESKIFITSLYIFRIKHFFIYKLINYFSFSPKYKPTIYPIEKKHKILTNKIICCTIVRSLTIQDLIHKIPKIKSIIIHINILSFLIFEILHNLSPNPIPHWNSNSVSNLSISIIICSTKLKPIGESL